ncbi:MAG: NifB/NifX family molybdenum-iron cluster-binding protein [Candidatus Krumholzibacteriota bacterium]
MRIAIPVTDGKLDPHFGHCRNFSLIDVDREQKIILNSETVDGPAHEPGVLPAWLAEQGVDLVLAGGMGTRAIQILVEHGIGVIVGVPSREPEVLIQNYFAGEIRKGTNACDH